MDKIILKVKTLSSIGYFHNYKFPKFVIYYGYIYIINPRKLDIILSLLELLYEFNNYCNFYNSGNITSWIEEKGLASYELLNEICYYKIKNPYDTNITDIYSFADYSLKNYHCEQETINKYLSHLLKETLKNLVIFNYLYNSKEVFNNYVSEIFNYYKSINMTPTKTFENFIYSILEIDKISLQDELDYINNINIICNSDNQDNILCIKKFQNGTQEFFQECIKNDLEIIFKIDSYDNNYIQKLKEYLQIAGFLTNKLLSEEFSILNTLSPTVKKSDIEKDKKNNNLNKANFSFINQRQILHYCLNEENKILLTKILPSEYINNSFEKVYYFEQDIDNKIRLVNYCQITVL